MRGCKQKELQASSFLLSVLSSLWTLGTEKPRREKIDIKGESSRSNQVKQRGDDGMKRRKRDGFYPTGALGNKTRLHALFIS